MPRRDTTTEARRTEVAARYLRGEKQSEIARSFGVSQSQISQDLKVIRAAWLRSAIRDFDAARAEELARIDQVEREYWQAWARSQQDKEASIEEQTDDPVATTGEDGKLQIETKTRTKRSVRREGQAGNPAFLDGVLRCIERRCKILGLDAPQRFTINWEELTPEQEERLARGEPPEKVLSA